MKHVFIILTASVFLAAAASILVPPLGAAISYSPSTDRGATCSGHPCVAAVTCPISACTSTDIQTALNVVQLGDTITIQAGKVWTVASTLTIYRKTAGSGYVTIRTSTDDSQLPAADTRITPVYKLLLPELRLTTNNVLLWVEQTTNAVEHYQFLGIWFSSQEGLDRTNDLVRLWDAAHHIDPSYTPNDIIFDRCLVLPAVMGSTRGGINLGIRNGTVKNSYFDQIKAQQDSQAISFPNSPGPVTINNNFLSAAGENIMVGGGVPTIPNLLPLDIDFTDNIFFKDPAELKFETWTAASWVRAGKIIDGGNGSAYIASASGTTGAISPVFPASACTAPPVCSGGCCVTDGTVTWQENFLGSSPKWTVKNSFEYKFMGRSVIQWNGIDGSWTDGQSGAGFSFKPESQCSLCWTPHTENLTVANNVIRNTERPFSFSGSGDDGGGITSNWNVHDNLAWSTNNPANTSIVHGGSSGLTFNHNTVDANQNTAWTIGDTAVPSLVYTNNLSRRGGYGFKRSATSEGVGSLIGGYTTYTFAKNVISGVSSFDGANAGGHYPPGNDGTAWASIGFTNPTIGDYSLASSSPYKNVGTDGADLGADTSQLPRIKDLTITIANLTATLAWKVTAPLETIPCSLEVSTNRDFSDYIEDLNPAAYARPDVTGTGLTRTKMIGVHVPLSNAATYWYRLHCGGAFEYGSFSFAALLAVAETHIGNFTAGQTGAAYSLTVLNATGAGPTSGTVTVAETVPAGMTLVSMVGTGWTCPLGGTTCTRSDSLNGGASYPAITVTVNVAASAPSAVTNQVSVSGGSSAPASVSDTTVIVTSPILKLLETHSGDFSQGQTAAVYTATVSNQTGAGPTSGTVTITGTTPAGLTLVSMAGSGWGCSGNTCTRTDVLSASVSYPAITVTVNVAASAPSKVTNQVSVSGGNSAPASASDTAVVVPSPIVSISPGSAAFVKTDITTQGSWKAVYGSQGANVIGDTASYPSYVTVTPTANAKYVWAASTSDVRAPSKLSSSTGRVAGCWYSLGIFTIDLNFTNGQTHQVALYALDFDNYNGRSEKIDVLDANGALLDTRSVSSFVGGQYLLWNLSGHVVFRVTNTNPVSNAVISGLFFGPGPVAPPPANTAAFVKTDITTQGSWKAVYGSQGANVIGDTASYPSYVTVTPTANANYVWAASTSDVRAPLKLSSSTGRVAGCWYSFGIFTIDLNFTDGQTHQVALYAVDFDNYNGRSEKIDVLDANGALLDTRPVSSFVGGQYLVWNLSGHVIVRITNTNPVSNAVIGALFFGPPA